MLEHVTSRRPAESTESTESVDSKEERRRRTGRSRRARTGRQFTNLERAGGAWDPSPVQMVGSGAPVYRARRERHMMTPGKAMDPGSVEAIDYLKMKTEMH